MHGMCHHRLVDEFETDALTVFQAVKWSQIVGQFGGKVKVYSGC
jgi:hypothetical protein